MGERRGPPDPVWTIARSTGFLLHHPSPMLIAFALSSALLTQAPVLEVSVLDGGDFELAAFPQAQTKLGTGIAFWRAPGGGARRVPQPGGGHALELAPGASLTQPFFAVPAALGSLRVTGRARGEINLGLVSDSGVRSQTISIDEPGGAWQTFEYSLLDLFGSPEAIPKPRFVLQISAGESGGQVDDLDVRLELPLPEPSERRAEVVARAREIFDLWMERGLDREGPIETAFCTRNFDVGNGEPSQARAPGCSHVLFEALLMGYEHLGDPRYQALLEAHTRDLIEHGLHPETKLPRYFNGATDEGYDGQDVEIARTLRFLIGVAEDGPAAVKEQALEAAIRIGEAVLEHGQLASGEVAGSFVPGTAQASAKLPSLRRLDVPAELVMLSRLTGDMRFATAARRALSTYEFLHLWAGSWDAIDPAFDDEFGHIGARSVRMAAAFPEDPLWARLAESALTHFDGIWEQTLRHGGFVAADQVRGWRVLGDLARVRPEHAPRIGELLHLAARAHLRGEQNSIGAWVDVSHHRFDPKLKLEVGDVPGPPANLLEGLALCRRPELGLDPDWVDAHFLAVLRSTFDAYGAPFGLVPSLPAPEGFVPSGASLRMLVALVEWLDASA